MGKANV